MSFENQELRKAGLKITLPRVKILQILESVDLGHRHMSAEDVYRALDRACGELRSAYGEDAFCLVVSDHGMGGAARVAGGSDEATNFAYQLGAGIGYAFTDADGFRFRDQYCISGS